MEVHFMINYSIHTYELSTTITFFEYMTIYQNMESLHASIEKQSHNYSMKQIKKVSYTFRKIHTPGINSVKITKIASDISVLQCYLYIIINPYNAYCSCEQSEEKIIDSRQIVNALQIIQRKLVNIFSSNIIKRLLLNRIDFCINLLFSTQSQAEEYIKLLRLGIPRKALKERMVFSESQHRNIPYEDSLLLECASYSFEIYPKYTQMKNQKLHGAEQALGMVRIELRADRAKILQLAKKYQINSPTENYNTFLEFAPSITNQEIPWILSKMVGNGNFYNYSHIKKEIESSNFKESEAHLMLQITSYFLRRKYSRNLLTNFNMQHKDWMKILQKFDQINCSPIPVPSSYSLSFFPGIASWNNFFS